MKLKGLIIFQSNGSNIYQLYKLARKKASIYVSDKSFVWSDRPNARQGEKYIV